jgi:hypothetical protein
MVELVHRLIGVLRQRRDEVPKVITGVRHIKTLRRGVGDTSQSSTTEREDRLSTGFDCQGPGRPGGGPRQARHSMGPSKLVATQARDLVAEGDAFGLLLGGQIGECGRSSLF